MVNKLSAFIFFLLLAFSIHAQDKLWFDEVNIDDGLSQSTILSMIQDKKGFIWIGTQYGLNRYDGYQFEIHVNEIGDDTSISSNYIVSIFEDSTGVLWVGTDNGLNAFNKTTNQFKRYLHNKNDKNSISNNLISSIAEDKLGNIWIGTAGGGLNKFNKQSGSFEKMEFKSIAEDDKPPLFVTHILADKDGMLWVTAGKARLRPTNKKGGIYFVNPQQNTLSRIITKTNQNIIDIESVTAVFQDDRQNIWFGTLSNGLFKKTHGSNDFKQYKLNNNIKENQITAIVQDELGNIWISTQHSGIYMLDDLSDILYNYNSTSPEISNLGDNDIVSMLIDSTGVFWIGSWTGGINKLDFNSFNFQKYLQLASKDHVSNPDILDVNQDSKGNVWLAAWENGLQKLDMQTGISQRPEILTYDVVGNVRHVFIDKKDKLWIGSNEKGLIYFDPEKNISQSYVNDPNDKFSLSHNKIIQIIKDSSDNLWIATRGGGLNYFNINEGKFYHYNNNVNNQNSLISDRINSLNYDDQGFIWVGTNKGLEIFDPVDGTVIAHYEGDAGEGSILGKNINVIFKDKLGRVWIGTEKGVSKVNFPENSDRKNLTFSWDIGFGKSQLGSVGAILDDSENNLWLSSFKYITRYNPETQEVKNYNASSGVLSGGYYIGSGHQDNEGKFYFGGLNGLTVFKAEENKRKTKEPQIVLTNLLLFNKPIFADSSENSILNDSIDNTTELDFNYKQNVFSLEFSALHYSSPKENQYAYKLEGFDEDWVFTDSSNRRATYTNLDAGKYQFFIKASNNEGVWSKPVRKLIISMHAAPWKTTLAYCIYFILATLIIGSFIWLRIKQMQAIKLRNEQLSLTSKLFENTSECVWLLDSGLNFLAINKGFCDITGYSEAEIIGKKIKMAEVNGQQNSFLTVIFSSVNNGGRWEGEMWAQRKSGEIYPIDIVIDRVILNNSHGGVSDYQYVGVFSDITQRKKAEEDLKFMAYYDKLTHLPNRAYFYKLVTDCIESGDENNQFIILYFDLDNFKNINDSLGHSYGDQLLEIITKRLNKFSDKRYIVARLGGDEFALMIPQEYIQGDVSGFATDLGDKLLKLIREKVMVKNHSLHVSISIGATIFPYDGKSHEELLRNADTAMYEAKKQGRNAFTLYSKNMNKLARRRLMLEDELNKAIIANEIIPYYQPKVSLVTGKLDGFEILARWNHVKLGWISPDQFIPVAEESKLINKISDQLLTQACRFFLPVIEKGDFSGRMSFNLSITQFLKGDIVSRIDEILDQCQFPSEYLEIEITESMVMGNIDQAIEIMEQFKLRNISIAIDDFGTGYSSLSYLKGFPIDVLKIDISFIKDLIHSTEDQKIVNSIIHLAHNLGLEVVAEGGETLEQIMILKKMGCEQLQGYYYSKPLPGDQYLEFISESKNLYKDN